MEMKPLSVEQLLNNKKCCGNMCKNCPYIPKHTKNSTLIEKITCEISFDGNKFWRNDKSLYHRENDLHAIECSDGTKYWYINGKCHRELGPAVICPNGTERWYLNGTSYLPEEMPSKLYVEYLKWEYRKKNGI